MLTWPRSKRVVFKTVEEGDLFPSLEMRIGSYLLEVRWALFS